MKYFGTGSTIKLGDQVVADGVEGVVICDYESQLCLSGYESWLTMEKLANGDIFSGGVMVKTEEYGFLYYSRADIDLLPRK